MSAAQVIPDTEGGGVVALATDDKLRWKLQQVEGWLAVLEEAAIDAESCLAALLPDPNKPDWMPALGNKNAADAKALDRAYKGLKAATDCLHRERDGVEC